MSDKKSAPVARINLFPISAAIWRNENQRGVFYSFTIERSYKDDKGKYATTNTFNPGDALLVSKIADLCDTKIRELRDADRQSDQTQDEAA